jgi:predicted O-methyltransferase YrrM
MSLEFTADWCSQHFAKWAEVLAPFKGKAVVALELGSYEGRSALWFLQNIVTDPASRLICVDSWRTPSIQRRFMLNLIDGDVYDRCEIRKGDTHSILRGLRQTFDFIFIDADHKAPAVITDAVLAWRILRPGGVLIFDDYEWQPQNNDIPPKVGVDAFLATHAGQYEVLHTGWQVILRKL